MPIIYVCQCGAELKLRFDEVRRSDSRRVNGFAYGVDDLFRYLHHGGETLHDMLDNDGEVLSEGSCRAEYERTGECNLCAECCKYLYQPISEQEMADLDHQHWLALRGGRIKRTTGGVWGVMFHPCQALLEETPGHFVCGCYSDRPDLCKRWPEHPWDTEPYPNCSFKFTRLKPKTKG